MLNCKILGKNYKGGDFDIYKKKRDSLAGCPQHITGVFNCGENNLTSLVGGPQRVDGDYGCSANQLTDLVGCASHISGKLFFSNNDITSLVGIHKIIKSCRETFFNVHEIKEGGIGLLLIKDLTTISSNWSLIEPFEIIEKYLGTGTKGMMECRSELISRGYDEYAKL